MTRRAVTISAWLVGVAIACTDPYVPRVGLPTLDDPVPGDFTAVSAGLEHTCALANTEAFCWGSNEGGQLGVPEGATQCPRDTRFVPCEPRPVTVSGGLAFKDIGAGVLHSCAVSVGGAVYCWGDNLRGQLGDPGVRTSATPVRVLSNDVFTQVAVGGYHSCGLRTDGVAMCWGANNDGQLGQLTVGSGSAIPTPVSTAQRFASIAAGTRRTCGRTSDGSVYCWGAIWVSRQNGADVVRPEGTPTRVTQAPSFRALAVGAASTCGISSDNDGFCWESNAYGTLGNGSTTPSTIPVAVASTLEFVQLSVGKSHTCAIGTDARAYCWGADDVGQLGRSPALLNHRCATQTVCAIVPQPVAGWRRYTSVSAGEGSHTCAVALSGSIYCWGAGGMGQRGDGRLSNEWAPVRVQPVP